jgi:NhaP-type Na+/H+ or K+/H+ antiporter
MTDYITAIVAVAVVAFAVVSKRLSRSALTGTMVFTAVGLLIGPEGLDLLPFSGPLGRSEIITFVLTATLVVVLFTDASAVNASKWREEILPARLLGIGLPLAIVFGWIVAYFLFDLEFWEAAVLGTMLAPTDAALGKAVVSNPRVPVRIRQALNVESGLNDGIALPFFLVFVETAQAVESSLDASQLVTEVVKQLGIAAVVGAVVGSVGARVIRWGRTSGNANDYWLQIGLLALAAVAYTVATPLGGSGFIAAWVAGLAFGRASRSFAAKTEDLDELSVFAETTGDLLTMMSFLIFGIFLGPVLAALTWQMAVYGVLSLAVVRLAAVTLAVIRNRMRWPTVLYIGWFGPRGLATIILTIEIVDESSLDHSSTIAGAALFTVGLSVLLHGLTAWWGSNRYADYVESHPDTDTLAEQDASGFDVRVPLRSQHRSAPR